MVETRLSKDGDGTMLELEHRSESDSPEWAPGVGAGWESGLMDFDFRVRGEDPKTIPTDVTHPALDNLWTEMAKNR